jgi:predicted transcriptional regulator
MPGLLPNDWRISCRRSSCRPHKPTLPLIGRREGDAGAEGRPPRPVGCMRLLGAAPRITLWYMKDAALTIRLDPALERQLEAVARASGRSKSEVVRDALRRQLALARFEGLRRRTLPFAEARGYLTDEDVYRDVS